MAEIDPRLAGGIGAGDPVAVLAAKVAALEGRVASLLRDPTGAQIRVQVVQPTIPAGPGGGGFTAASATIVWDRPFATEDYTVLYSVEFGFCRATGRVQEKYVDHVLVEVLNYVNIPIDQYVRAIAIANVPGESG